MWASAFGADKRLALKLLLWARDVRGGAGERKLFRICFEWLKSNYPEDAKSILHKVPEVGRWDDLLSDNFAFDFIAANISNPLLCKWFPRRSNVFYEFAKYINVPLSELRKNIVSNSKTVEQLMSSGKWDEVIYKSVPSRAMGIYSKAFGKHDKTRFDEYKAALVKGETKINAGALYPYDIIRNFEQGKDTTIIDEQWKALPNYGNNENILVVADVSGSMTTGLKGNIAPIYVSISLAMYISERNTGIFKDAFMTFSNSPKIEILKGSNVATRYAQLKKAEWGYNTNLQAVFNTLLQKAVLNNLSQEDMPTKVIIISDMEFDQACSDSNNFDAIVDKYNATGYKLPNLVFWNVNSKSDNFPVKFDTRGTALISGCSPVIMKSIFGEITTPEQIMLNTIDIERYNF